MGKRQTFSIPVRCAGSKQLGIAWGLGWVGWETGIEKEKEVGGARWQGGR